MRPFRHSGADPSCSHRNGLLRFQKLKESRNIRLAYHADEFSLSRQGSTFLERQHKFDCKDQFPGRSGF